MKNFFKNNSTRCFVILAIFIASISLSSCLDYVQSVSYKDGKYQFYYKITCSKALLEFAEEENEDYQEYVDEINKELNLGENTGMPADTKFSNVNTTSEVGMEFRFSISPSTDNEDEKAFLPKTSGTKYYIPFLIGDKEMDIASAFKSSDDKEEMEYTKLFLSSAKCRLLISKRIIQNAATAYFEGKGGQNCSVALFDYGENYCVEVPLIQLFDDKMYDFSRVVIIRGE